jgi:hypothetical protein
LGYGQLQVANRPRGVTKPNGSSTNVKYVYKRMAGTSGFAGTWESTSETLNSVYMIKIQPYEGDGLSFINSSQGVTRNITFEGKDHPLVARTRPRARRPRRGV